MFARKGTAIRKKPPKRSRKSSFPGLPSDQDIGELSSVSVRSEHSGRCSEASVHSLSEEQTAAQDSKSYLTDETYPPVTYGAILLQLHVESVSLSDFLQRIWEVVWQSFAMTVLLLFLFGLPISMVAMGTSYLEECPKEPKVPIYLLVGGAFGFIHICILLWQQKRSRAYMVMDDSKDDIDSDEDEENVMTRSYQFTWYILSLFLVVWFVLGNYWIFSIWQPNFAQPLHEPQNWCSKYLYNYSLYNVIVCYSFAGVVCIVFLACLVAYFCR